MFFGMTSALVTLVAVIVVVALVIAGVVLWYMNRTPSYVHDETGALPLFGNMPSADDAAGDDRGTLLGGAARLQAQDVAALSHPMDAARAVHSLESAELLDVESTSTASSTVKQLLSTDRRANRTKAPASSTINGANATTPKTSPAIRTFTTKPKGAALGETARRSPTSVTPVGSSTATPANSPVFGHGVPGIMVEGHLLRFAVPQEGTLQFLPGRFEIGAGVDSGREIRFVRVPGPKGTEVTFGRSEGEMYRHVQLRDQTVSRSHAKMQLVEGQWYLCNLSQTNPVVHNGRVLANGDEYLLADGDRIEMGEVLFTFRSR